MLSDGVCTYSYDSANHLATVSSNGALQATNFYDAKSRRVRKATSEATTTFFYDGWNLVEEHIAYTNGASSTIHYYWGKGISGSLQGTGGVGGLLYLTVDGAVYVPCYDNNGNIVCYVSESGTIAAQYVYDPYGNIVEQYGSNPSLFNFGFSTKYLDREVDLVGYQYRFLRPSLGRWLNRDPIGERDGENLYAMCNNNRHTRIDYTCHTHIWNAIASWEV